MIPDVCTRIRLDSRIAMAALKQSLIYAYDTPRQPVREPPKERGAFSRITLTA